MKCAGAQSPLCFANANSAAIRNGEAITISASTVGISVKNVADKVAQLALFAAEVAGVPPAVAARATQSAQAVALPPGTPPVAELVAQPAPPQPEFDCYLHPRIRSRWYLVGRRWTCAVCYPQIGDRDG